MRAQSSSQTQVIGQEYVVDTNANKVYLNERATRQMLPGNHGWGQDPLKGHAKLLESQTQITKKPVSGPALSKTNSKFGQISRISGDNPAQPSIRSRLPKPKLLKSGPEDFPKNKLARKSPVCGDASLQNDSYHPRRKAGDPSQSPASEPWDQNQRDVSVYFQSRRYPLPNRTLSLIHQLVCNRSW